MLRLRRIGCHVTLISQTRARGSPTRPIKNGFAARLSLKMVIISSPVIRPLITKGLLGVKNKKLSRVATRRPSPGVGIQ